MLKKGKKYSPSEKLKVVIEVLKGDLTYSQITSKFGIHSTQIRKWKEQFHQGLLDIFRDKRQKDSLEKDKLIEELYQKIGQQEVELDWLKKKSELFHSSKASIDRTRAG